MIKLNQQNTESIQELIDRCKKFEIKATDLMIANEGATEILSWLKNVKKFHGELVALL